MTWLASEEIVDPKALSVEKRQQLTDELYAVHTQIFAGVDRESFARYVVDSSAEVTEILRHRNAAGEVVGYHAMHLFERHLNGRPTTVLRAEAGLLRDYRGGNASASFGLRFALRHLARRPGRPAYYLGSLVHPSSYGFLARYMPGLWPRAGAVTPPELLEFMNDLATEFGLPRVKEEDPLVRQVGWRTIESDVERDYWLRSDKPAARFFIDVNPDFAAGHGLVTLVPLTTRSLGGMLGAIVRRRARAPVAVARALVEATPLGAQAVRASTLRHLRSNDLFGTADDATLERLAERAQPLTIAGGRTVFERGDVSDELYLLVSGAVYIVNGEEIIDELSPGTIFGELAMLAGDRRSATVRAATTSVIVRITREALRPLMEADEQLAARVWHSFGARRFDDLVRLDARHAHLGRRAREAWYAAGEHATLAAGETALLTAGSPTFIVSGVLELEHEGLAVLARGSLVLEPREPLMVRAREPVRLVRLATAAVTAAGADAHCLLGGPHRAAPEPTLG